MKRVLLTSLAALIAVAGSTAFATAPASAVGAVRQQDSEERCRTIETILTTKADNLDSAVTTRALQYQRLHIMVNTNISKLKQAGYDTTKLEADLLTVKNLLTDYREQITTLQTSLTAVKEKACLANRAEYLKALQAARQELKDTRVASQKLRTMYTDSIILDIKDAASWLRKN